MRLQTSLAIGLVFLALLRPGRVGAQYNCCFMGSSPPILDGARLAAGSPEEARERTERLGFTWSDPKADAPGELGIIHFQRGGISWESGPGGEYAGLSAFSVEPAIAKRTYMSCYPMPVFEPKGSDSRAQHPNAAIGIVGVIGLVGDLDEAVQRDRRELDWRFERESFARDLGASCREAKFRLGGFVRLLTPVAADAPCAGWSSPGSGRWIGVVIESENLAATAAWMDAHRVEYRWVSRHEGALQVGPGETGGVLFEFVQRGWRPRA